MNRVLVYGTLRPGIHPVVKVPGKMFNIGWFPGVVLDTASEETFNCELVEVTDKVLNGLDGYEGYNPSNVENSLYRRVQLEGVSPDIDGAYLYVFNQDLSGYETVAGGDWLAFTDQERGRNSQMLEG